MKRMIKGIVSILIMLTIFTVNLNLALATAVDEVSSEHKKSEDLLYQDILDTIGSEATIFDIQEVDEFEINYGEIIKPSLMASEWDFYGDVTFTQTNWGNYHEYKGNKIAIAIVFTDSNGNLIPNVGMNVSLRRYGNNISDASVFAYGDNTIYSTTGSIIPELSYRYYYQLTTNYTGWAKVRISAVSYN